MMISWICFIIAGVISVTWIVGTFFQKECYEYYHRGIHAYKDDPEEMELLVRDIRNHHMAGNLNRKQFDKLLKLAER